MSGASSTVNLANHPLLQSSETSKGNSAYRSIFKSLMEFWERPKIILQDATMNLSDIIHIELFKPSVCSKNRSAEQLAIMDEGAEGFITKHNLNESVNYLKEQILIAFPDTTFDFETVTDESEEDTMLALRVYSSLSHRDFKERKKEIYRKLRNTSHKELYYKIGIVQQKGTTN